MNASEYLEDRAWKTPDYYGGFDPVGDYCIQSHTRDGGLIDECNWESACDSLYAEDYGGGNHDFENRPAVYTFRASHWAFGWVEYLMVRQDAPEEIRNRAGEIVCALGDYPILNEDLYSRRKDEAVHQFWEWCSVRERAAYLSEVGLSIFAARRDYLPEDPHGRLYELLSEGL